jgi:hypothetical protein
MKKELKKLQRLREQARAACACCCSRRVTSACLALPLRQTPAVCVVPRQVRGWAASNEIKDAAIGPRLLDARHEVEREMVRGSHQRCCSILKAWHMHCQHLVGVVPHVVQHCTAAVHVTAGAVQAAGERGGPRTRMSRRPAPSHCHSLPLASSPLTCSGCMPLV